MNSKVINTKSLKSQAVFFDIIYECFIGTEYSKETLNNMGYWFQTKAKHKQERTMCKRPHVQW